MLHGSAVNSGRRVVRTDGTERPGAGSGARRGTRRRGRRRSGSLSYLEAHGTGTALGDPIELNAAWSVLGRDRRPGEPLLVGSVKSNIGHCESAAGIAGVIKTVLALRHELLPGNLHCETLNPHVPWRDMNVRVVDASTPWRRGDRPRLAGVSGFGASGTNAHVIVGEAPAAAPAHCGEGPFLVPLSAPDSEGLARLAAVWDQHLDGASDAGLAPLAMTAGAGRAHFPVRRAVLGRTAEELLAQLREPAGTDGPTRPPRVGFLFSGQGSQYFGMGRELYETEPVFREVFDACDRHRRPDSSDSRCTSCVPWRRQGSGQPDPLHPTRAGGSGARPGRTLGVLGRHAVRRHGPQRRRDRRRASHAGVWTWRTASPWSPTARG